MTVFEDSTKQEVWETVRAMNETWTKGDAGRLADFFHPNMVAVTPTDRRRLEGGPRCLAAWKGFSEATRIHRWEEVDPIIHVYGDAAVVVYDYDMSFDMAGRTIDTGGRDMFFFVREGGRWWAVADQFSPYPKEP
jgi:ketosteroid isomerase-like protein